jgi:hypothetical protein
MAPNVARGRRIIKHVFEACRIGVALPEVAAIGGRKLSVGCPIVWQQFDHMFYKSNV